MQDLIKAVMRDYGAFLPQGFAEGGLVAPSYSPIPGAEIEGGGYAPQPSINPNLQNMLKAYGLVGGSEYSQPLRDIRKQREEAETQFNAALQNMAESKANAPSQSEMYWRLASAFATPGKTGDFIEGVGNAANVMAEHKSATRQAEEAQRKLKQDIALKQQEYSLQNLRDDEKTLLALRSEEGKDQREMLKTVMKEYIDSGKPASEAGRIAKDMGLKPGTPEYQSEVDKQANLLIEKQMGAIRAQLMTGQAQLANLALQQGKEARAAVSLDPDERKSVREDEDAVYAAEQAIKNLTRALPLLDQAFTSSAADQTLYKKLKQTNPNDPRVIATEQLENYVGQNTIAGLRAAFGGNPTEGERTAMANLGGLGAASRQSRRTIMENTIKGLTEGKDYRTMRIDKILSGGYKKKPKE